MAEVALNQEAGVDERIIKSLSIEAVGFLERYANELPENGERLALESREYISGILKGSQDFERAVNDLDQAGILLSDESIKKLKEVRESMGEDFTDALIEHYGNLEKEISTIIRKVQNRGMDYIMNGTKGYNEEIAQDLEEVLGSMTLGYRQLNRQILEGKSPDYAKVRVDLERQRSELDRISEIFHMLESDASPEEIKEKMMSLIKNSLHHMHDGIAGQTDIVISKLPSEQYHRGLDTLKGGVLQQLEFLSSLITRSVYAARDIRIQKTFLLGRDVELEEEAVMSA
jgi:hypothetical protein